MDFAPVPGDTVHFTAKDGRRHCYRTAMYGYGRSRHDRHDSVPERSHFFEFDGTNLTRVDTDPPNSASFATYQGRMLLLPSGDVLVTAYDQARRAPSRFTRTVAYPRKLEASDHWREQHRQSGTCTVSRVDSSTGSRKAPQTVTTARCRQTIRCPHDNRASGHVFYARAHDHSQWVSRELGAPKYARLCSTCRRTRSLAVPTSKSSSTALRPRRWDYHHGASSLPAPFAKISPGNGAGNQPPTSPAVGEEQRRDEL